MTTLKTVEGRAIALYDLHLKLTNVGHPIPTNNEGVNYIVGAHTELPAQFDMAPSGSILNARVLVRDEWMEVKPWRIMSVSRLKYPGHD